MADRREWTRREFVRAAAGIGAALAWPPRGARLAPLSRTERRDLFPEGVASGDPAPTASLLWTRRRRCRTRRARRLTVEVGDDAGFERVVARGAGRLGPEPTGPAACSSAGWSRRSVYWYRFIDEHGNGSRIGRTLHRAGRRTTRAPVRFAFVSCQNVSAGRPERLSPHDLRGRAGAPEDQLGFVLHLGDFVYEVVWYPGGSSAGHRYDRRLRDVVRYPHGEKIRDFHVPADARRLSRALPRLPARPRPAGRARPLAVRADVGQPRVLAGEGWQSLQNFEARATSRRRRARSRRTRPGSNTSRRACATARRLDSSASIRPEVTRRADRAVRRPRASARSRTISPRSTASSLPRASLRPPPRPDHHRPAQLSRPRMPTSRPEARPALEHDFPDFVPAGGDGDPRRRPRLRQRRQPAGDDPPSASRSCRTSAQHCRPVDAGRTAEGLVSRPAARARGPPGRSGAIRWARSTGAPIRRTSRRPGRSPGPAPATPASAAGDCGTAYTERAEIFDAVRETGITGFAIVSGDRHSFWAGLAAKALPPAAFEPVGVAFITGSISAPGLVEAYEHNLPKDHPLQAALSGGPSRRGQARGRRSTCCCATACARAWSTQRSGDLATARRAVEPGPRAAPVLRRHGRPRLRHRPRLTPRRDRDASSSASRGRSNAASGEDGGPLRYRVVAPRAALAARRAAGARAAPARGRSRARGTLAVAPPGKQTRGAGSPSRPRAIVPFRSGLLHRVHHVEDRQVHRDHHAADDHAEEHDHHRLHEARAARSPPTSTSSS